MKTSDVVNIDDMAVMARRRLPRIAFDYVDGGVDGEAALARNRAAFDRYRIVPRYLVDVGKRSATTRLFGHDDAAPFGICRWASPASSGRVPT